MLAQLKISDKMIFYKISRGYVQNFPKMKYELRRKGIYSIECNNDVIVAADDFSGLQTLAFFFEGIAKKKNSIIVGYSGHWCQGGTVMINYRLLKDVAIDWNHERAKFIACNVVGMCADGDR